MKYFKIILSLTLILVVVFSTFAPISVASSVVYSGDAGNFIFSPGSEHSPTDLFTEFKDVMPGDSIQQTIVVRNDASIGKKVKISMRSLGAVENADFLSQMYIRVEKVGSTNMFDASAEKSAQLTNWVELGTLYSGGEVTLNVILEIPTSVDNSFQSQIGKLDWEFAVEEFDIEPSDPKPPETGDNSNIKIWFITFIASGIFILLIVFLKLRKRNEDVK